MDAVQHGVKKQNKTHKTHMRLLRAALLHHSALGGDRFPLSASLSASFLASMSFQAYHHDDLQLCEFKPTHVFKEDVQLFVFLRIHSRLEQGQEDVLQHLREVGNQLP